MRSRRASERNGPITWTPTGSPDGVRPAGRVTTGRSIAPIAPHPGDEHEVRYGGAVDVEGPLHGARRGARHRHLVVGSGLDPYQPWLPGTPLNGPPKLDVIQPP